MKYMLGYEKDGDPDTFTIIAIFDTNKACMNAIHAIEEGELPDGIRVCWDCYDDERDQEPRWDTI